MTFADVALGARIERAESQGTSEAARLARKRRGVDALVEPLSGGYATLADDGSPLNKVAGLGFEGELDVAALERIERAWDARGVPVRVELSTLGDPSIGAALTRRGYVLTGFEDVLGRALSSADAHAPELPGIEVVSSEAESFDAWLDLVVTGFASPDDQGIASDEEFPREVLERVIGDMAAMAGFRRYIALREGVAAGGASLRVADGIAQLFGAATLPQHRRRGVQSALLAHRIALAASAGCEIVVVTTQPGSKSQENVQRQGFALLYSRAALVREL